CSGARLAACCSVCSLWIPRRLVSFSSRSRRSSCAPPPFPPFAPCVSTRPSLYAETEWPSGRGRRPSALRRYVLRRDRRSTPRHRSRDRGPDMKALRRFVKRLSASAFGRRDDDRVREELAEHVELATEDLVRTGVPIEEARRRARL